MRPTLLTTALAIGFGVLAARADEVKGDLKRMQGVWKATILEVGGKKLSEEDRQKVDVRLEVKGNRYSVFFNDQVADQGTVKLYEGQKPRGIDATVTEGPNKDKTMKGVYVLEGDRMKVLFAQPGQDRPRGFQTEEGTKQILVTYQRVIKEKKE